MTAWLFIHTDIIDVQSLDILQKPVVLNLANLAEGMYQYLAVIIDEYGLVAIVENVFKFLFRVFGGVAFEQVGTNAIVNGIYLL